MSIIQSVTALFRSPEAAAMVATAVQASDLAARQGQANLKKQAVHDEELVQVLREGQEAPGVRGRQAPPEQRPRHRQSQPAAPPEAGAPAAKPSQRLDILA